MHYACFLQRYIFKDQWIDCFRVHKLTCAETIVVANVVEEMHSKVAGQVFEDSGEG